VFFYPVLSPVVVALIWKWICSARASSTLLVAGGAWRRLALRCEPALVRVCQHLGAHGLLHLILGGRPAGDSAELYEAARWTGQRPGGVSRINPCAAVPNLIVVLVLGLIRAVQIFDGCSC
jgi:alpha-1,4-digalacturonate transport system permease protein